jgi:hypothetical protein
VSCNRDHHNFGSHVGYLVLGVQEGGEGDIPSSLILGVKLLGPCYLFEPFTAKVFWFVRIVDVDLLSHSLGSHVEHLVGLGHGDRGGGEGGV